MQCNEFAFTALTFTSPGTHTYTVRELTPPDGQWIPDGREFRVVVTVERNDDGTLTASAEYPDGYPAFVNVYHPPPEPPAICECFHKIPFPMHWFAPPQKPEFEAFMKSNYFSSSSTISSPAQPAT